MEFYPEFQTDYKLLYSHLKSSLTKLLDDHYAESAHKFFALSQSGRITSVREQTTDQEWTKITTYKPVTNSQRISRVSSQLEMALSNPAAIININMSYPSGKFNWSPDQIPFENEINQQINSCLPLKASSTDTQKDIINLMEGKFDNPEKKYPKFKINNEKALEEEDNLSKCFLCNEQDGGDEVEQSSNDDNLDSVTLSHSGHILTNEDNDHVSNRNSTEKSIEVDDPINSFVSVANGDSLNNSGPRSSLLNILESSCSSMHQFELINDSSSNMSLSSHSINSNYIHHELNVNDNDYSKSCPREKSRKAILSTNADANEHMDFGHGHSQIYLSSSSIFKSGNPILDLPNDDCKVSHGSDDDMFELATPLFSGNEARPSTLIDANLDFASDTLSCLDDINVGQNEFNEQMSASQHDQIVSSASPFEELNKTILESLEIKYDKTSNDQNEELPVFNENCLDGNELLTILPTSANEQRSLSPIVADPHSPDILDGFDDIIDEDIISSASNKPIIDSQHSRTILSLSPIKESRTSLTGGIAPLVLNCQEPLPSNADSIIKLNDNANEHEASKHNNRLSPNQSCVNIGSAATSNLIVTLPGAHDNDSVILNTSIELKVIDDTEHNQDFGASSSKIQDSSFVSNDSLDSPVSMKINGNDQRGKLYFTALTSTPSTDGNASQLSSVSNASGDSIIFLEEVKPEVRMTDPFVQSPLPFKCPKGCLIKLKTTNELKNHYKKVHKLDPFLCLALNCNASFEHAHLLQRHKDMCHPKSQEYSCLRCYEQFDSKWDFDEHLKGCNG